MDLVLVGAAVGFFIALIYAFLFIRVYRQSKQQSQLLEQHAEHVATLQQKVQQTTNEQEEMRSATFAMFNRVKQLEEEISTLQVQQQTLLEQLNQQQQSMLEQDPQSRFYSKGVKLVSQGATIEEVMRECEMPLAEAELLFNLHHKQS